MLLSFGILLNFVPEVSASLASSDSWPCGDTPTMLDMQHSHSLPVSLPPGLCEFVLINHMIWSQAFWTPVMYTVLLL